MCPFTRPYARLTCSLENDLLCVRMTRTRTQTPTRTRTQTWTQNRPAPPGELKVARKRRLAQIGLQKGGCVFASSNGAEWHYEGDASPVGDPDEGT
eukprot:1195968-Prorocentrum_minimum.AAC.7